MNPAAARFRGHPSSDFADTSVRVSSPSPNVTSSPIPGSLAACGCSERSRASIHYLQGIPQGDILNASGSKFAPSAAFSTDGCSC